MKLYQDPRAPNPRRVRMFLHEKQVLDKIELVEVSINARSNEGPEHLARNPLGLLPVLELPNGHLCETMAICRWIDEHHPEPNLFGEDSWERAKIEQWNRHAELELLWPIAQVFRNTHSFWEGRIRQAAEFGEIMKERVSERMTWFDQELGTREFVAGHRFTVADITAICALDFAKVVGIRVDPTLQPNLERWRKDVSSRPSAKA